MKTTLHLFMGVILVCLSAHADGGVVRLRQTSGPFLVTVFTASEPLRVGPIDASVLVQDRETGTVILDTTVSLVFQPVADERSQRLTRATFRQARNKLLQTATIDVPAPGWWAVQVFVRRDGEKAVFATRLFVIPAAPRWTAIWPFLVLPPFAIGLYVLHQRK
jgi:hypothetical protein